MIIKNNEFKEIDIKLVSTSFNPSVDEVQLINEQWNSLLEKSKKQNKKLWDEPCYRLEKYHIDNNATLHLDLSFIPFSIRYALRFLPNLTINNHKLSPKALVVQALVKTNDDYYVFGKKSQKFHTTLSYAFIGGVYGPYNGLLSKPYAALSREMHEELGIEKDKIIYKKPFGIYENINKNYNIVYQVHLDVSLQELIDIFQNSNRDDELDEILGIRKNDVVDFVTKNIPSCIGIKELF